MWSGVQMAVLRLWKTRLVLPPTLSSTLPPPLRGGALQSFPDKCVRRAEERDSSLDIGAENTTVNVCKYPCANTHCLLLDHLGLSKYIPRK